MFLIGLAILVAWSWSQLESKRERDFQVKEVKEQGIHTTLHPNNKGG